MYGAKGFHAPALISKRQFRLTGLSGLAHCSPCQRSQCQLPFAVYREYSKSHFRWLLRPFWQLSWRPSWRPSFPPFAEPSQVAFVCANEAKRKRVSELMREQRQGQYLHPGAQRQNIQPKTHPDKHPGSEQSTDLSASEVEAAAASATAAAAFAVAEAAAAATAASSRVGALSAVWLLILPSEAGALHRLKHKRWQLIPLCPLLLKAGPKTERSHNTHPTCACLH